MRATEIVGRYKAYSEEERSALTTEICALMSTGTPMGPACERVGVPRSTFNSWQDSDPVLAQQCAHARDMLLDHWAEEVLTVADEPPPYVVDLGGGQRLDGAAVQHARLRVDSRKWLLSKLAPKRYGEKVVQEHTGVDGGPITVAAVNLQGLTDAELEQMRALMSKASIKA